MSDFKMPDLSALMQTAQKLQSDLAKKQEELAARKFEASAGGGMVSATVNGHGELTKLVVEPTIVDPKDVSLLQDLVMAAVNQAVVKMREATQSEMQKLTGGLAIPGITL